MNLRSADNSKSRFAAYVEGLVSVIGHVTGPPHCEIIAQLDNAVRA